MAHVKKENLYRGYMVVDTEEALIEIVLGPLY